MAYHVVLTGPRALRRTVRYADFDLDDQAMAVFAHRMSHVTEFGRRASTLY